MNYKVLAVFTFNFDPNFECSSREMELISFMNKD